MVYCKKKKKIHVICLMKWSGHNKSICFIIVKCLLLDVFILLLNKFTLHFISMPALCTWLYCMYIWENGNKISLVHEYLKPLSNKIDLNFSILHNAPLKRKSCHSSLTLTYAKYSSATPQRAGFICCCQRSSMSADCWYSICILGPSLRLSKRWGNQAANRF